ncbi:nuclear polyadenosine RNA-binding 2 isoform X2 [Oratosquilla oratoria]|uniref:nuclear polyadenosine RNA-binding 2 isoform X2 n=1 Tax=Oratosquilla oratoria TaxID=337810 RepID=UPI003F76A593
MEGVNPEVSQKIKSAIKAKLVELGTYVDDDLPDYIMVLVANRKTKDQMDDDLSLFLGHSTERFTSWLHHVLQRLNAVTFTQDKTPKEEPKKKEKSEDKKKGKDEKKKEKGRPEKKRKNSENKAEKKEEQSKKKKLKKSEVVEPVPDVEKVAKEKVVPEEPSKLKLKETVKEKIRAPSPPKEVKAVKSKEVKEVIKPIVEQPPKEIKSLPKGKVSSADIFRAETEGIDDEDLAEDVVDLKADIDDLGLELEEDPAPKKAQTVGLTTEQTRVSVKKRLRNVAKEEPKAKVPVVPDLHTSTSSGRRVINLREESSFPPPSSSSWSVNSSSTTNSIASSSSGSGTTGAGSRLICSAVASAVRSVSVLPPTSQSSGRKLEARVKPLVSGRVVSAVVKRPHKEVESDEEDAYDPNKPGLSSMASKVEVTPRPRRPGAIQANTTLILRAMADAHKSVNRPPKRPALSTEQQPKSEKKELFTRSYREKIGLTKEQALKESRRDAGVRQIAITVPNATRREAAGTIEKVPEDVKVDLQQMEDEDEVMKDVEEEPILCRAAAAVRPQELQVSVEEEMVVANVDQPMVEAVEVPEDIEDEGIVEDQPPPPPPPRSAAAMGLEERTRFIVTLEGVERMAPPREHMDLRARLGPRPQETMEEVEDIIEEVEEWEEEEITSVAPKPRVKSTVTQAAPNSDGKVLERCRFWPACRDGDACPFQHPTTPCKAFPNCLFGERCLYIHPNCRYDASCTRRDCPFTHASPRHLSTPASVVVKPKPPAPPSATKCRFFPKCTNMTCKFFHPKACRYGTSCMTSNCPFSHPEIPTGAKLKWIAPKQSTTVPTTST